MPAQVQVCAGPARSGKTAELLARYRQILAGQGDGNISQRVLWLAPTRHAATEIRGQILDGGLCGCFNPGVYTFEQFAQALIMAAESPPQYLGQLLKRQLIQRLLAEAMAADKLSYFAPIADTAGLVDLMAGVIGDLKRQEVSPDKLSELAHSADGSEKTREIAAIYKEYQRILNEHHMYDVEGRFAVAGKLLRETPPEKWGSFSAVQYLVLDGFTDFTRSQHEVLQLLATKHPALTELKITLPLEQETGRADLFFKPQQTLKLLQERHPQLQLHWQPRQTESGWPALAHLERYVFANPRGLPPATDTAGIEIIATSGQKAELEVLARRIKKLLVHGDSAGSSVPSNGHGEQNPRPVRPDEVAVVFRSLEPVSALVEEVFSEYGIPAAIDLPPRLGRSPMLQALLALLRLQSGDWPFRQLLAVVGNNYFRPNWPAWQEIGAPLAVDWSIRQLQVPSGRKTLISNLEWRTKSGDAVILATANDAADEPNAQRKAEQRQRFAVAHHVLSQLSKTLPSPEKRRPLSDWIGILQRLVDELGLLRTEAEHAPLKLAAPAGNDDQHAWQSLKNVLSAASQLEQKLDGEGAPLGCTLPEFIARLQDILAVEALPNSSELIGKIRVLAAQSIRAISVPYLFVAGMAEKVFPPPVRDDRIYTEAEYRSLSAAGISFVDNRQRSCEEMLLFYEVATRPMRQLVLSYPALDSAAQPLLASPYVTELQHALGIEPVEDISLSPVPQHHAVCSPTELRVRAVAELMEDRPQPLAQFLRPRAAATSPSAAAMPGLLAGLQAIAARRKSARFGPFEGLLLGAKAQERLQRHFGPEHCWSVSRLEDYAYCPYQFFAKHVLDLEELPELTLEVDYGRRGGFAHDVLAHLHRRLNKVAQQSPGDLTSDDYEQVISEILDALHEALQGSPLEIALQTVDLQLIKEWLGKYVAQHADYDKSLAASTFAQPLRPAYFEVSFGLQPRESPEIDQLSTNQPFHLRCGEEVVRLSGRIDRIDTGVIGNQIVFNVLDYKTGVKKNSTLPDVQSGLALQLPLYALAVQELLLAGQQALPWQVGYWWLKEKGFHTSGIPPLFELGAQGLCETEEWKSLRAEILARVVSLVQGIRGGKFPVFGAEKNCTTNCAYSTICRINQIRSLGKAWPEATAEPSHSHPAADQVAALP
ncbi:MAG TPA: PD-(D/E)XK nuclease family protein [Pirellulales bacterium]|jgi:ATP-dependent helicase/DNAse subunit B|nr:PD-(D/E)XK nuclease family protein [Pirellulales bacterium]